MRCVCSTTQDFGVRIQTCDTFEAELIQCTISNVVTQDFMALVGCYENLGVYNHMPYVVGPVCRIDSSGNNSSILVLMVNVEVVTIFRIPFQTTLGSLAPKTTYSSFSCGSGMPQVDWTRLGLSTRVHVLACQGRIRTRFGSISRPAISTGWDYRTDFRSRVRIFLPSSNIRVGGLVGQRPPRWRRRPTVRTRRRSQPPSYRVRVRVISTVTLSLGIKLLLSSDPIRSDPSVRFSTLL